MRRALLLVVATIVIAAWGLEAQQNSADFGGRVFDSASKTGIQNLEIKLTPPKTMKGAIRIATTDRNGEFVFRRLVRGRYLMEVSQGITLLYRQEIDAVKADRVDVPLKRRT
jgi:hypothetical protein